MKKAFYILLILISFVNCQPNNQVEFIRKQKILVDNDFCDISFYYPEINTDSFKLNEILYHIPDYEFYTHRCDEENEYKKEVKGDFEIVFTNDTIISIEYITIVKYEKKSIQDTVYHSIVMNIKSLTKNKWDLLWGESPEIIYKNFDRGKLKPYVEKYNKTAEYKANILAYETNSRYIITWGINKDNFLLYVGGEGEAFGYDKIMIPIKEIKK